MVRTGERFGLAHVSQVLRGADTKRVRELRHDKLSVYGIVADLSDADLKELAELLLAKGLLGKNSREYATLGVNRGGPEVPQEPRESDPHARQTGRTGPTPYRLRPGAGVAQT